MVIMEKTTQNLTEKARLDSPCIPIMLQAFVELRWAWGQLLLIVWVRGLRGALKADSKGIPVELARRFRDEVKSLELEAERVELDTLGRLLEGPGLDDTDSRTQQNMMFEGLARYLDGLPASAGELDHDRITQLVAAVTG